MQICVQYLILWGNNFKEAVEDMLGISFDPGAHLDFDFISTKEPISTHPRSSHDMDMVLRDFIPLSLFAVTALHARIF